MNLFKRIKEYFLLKFLPAYAKELWQETKAENIKLKQEIRELNAYINGLETACKRIKIINNINGSDE